MKKENNPKNLFSSSWENIYAKIKRFSLVHELPELVVEWIKNQKSEIESSVINFQSSIFK